MLNYRKTMDLKNIFESMVDREAIIKSLFLDIPELDNFQFSVTNEYDDSNYSDQVTLFAINGHYVDYEGRYEDEEDYGGEREREGDESKLPRIRVSSQISAIMDVAHEIGNYYGYDDHKIEREDFESKRLQKIEKERMRYLQSYISKEEIEEEWFLKADPKWACYYAQDHGKFNKEIEEAIFCQEGRMQEAYMYAQAIKKPLNEKIENYFMTKNLISPNENDDIWLKEYLRFKQTLKKPKVKQNSGE